MYFPSNVKLLFSPPKTITMVNIHDFLLAHFNIQSKIIAAIVPNKLTYWFVILAQKIKLFSDCLYYGLYRAFLNLYQINIFRVTCLRFQINFMQRRSTTK